MPAETVIETPWRTGRIDSRRGPKRVLFGRMYEDVAVEDRAFLNCPRILSIASAGDTAIHLSRSHAVTAVDINPVQLSYAEARAAGVPPRIGAAERLMQVGRAALILAGWSHRILDQFLDLEDPAEQIAFWNTRLNTHRFQLALDTLLGISLLRVVYSSALLDSLPPHFGAVMRARLEHTWATHSNRFNPYARALLLGPETESNPPPIPRSPIRFVPSEVTAFLEQSRPATFDGFTLSNICDGMAPAVRERLFTALRHAGTPGSVLVLRSFSDPPPSLTDNLAHTDRCPLWGILQVRKVRDL